jgi:hypothetical protein
VAEAIIGTCATNRPAREGGETLPAEESGEDPEREEMAGARRDPPRPRDGQAPAARLVSRSSTPSRRVRTELLPAFVLLMGFRCSGREPMAMARMFDWRDMELVQCVRNGPVDPDGLRAIRRALGR